MKELNDRETEAMKKFLGKLYEQEVNTGILLFIKETADPGDMDTWKLYTDAAKSHLDIPPERLFSITPAIEWARKNGITDDAMSDDMIRFLAGMFFVYGYNLFRTNLLSDIKAKTVFGNESLKYHYSVRYLQLDLSHFSDKGDRGKTVMQKEIMDRMLGENYYNSIVEQGKGYFTHADTLVHYHLFNEKEHTYHEQIFVSDESCFTDIFSRFDYARPEDILYEMLEIALKFRLSSVFRQTIVKDEAEKNSFYSGTFINDGFSLSMDKPFRKAVQAASYMYDYMNQLSRIEKNLMETEVNGVEKFNFKKTVAVGAAYISEGTICQEYPAAEDMQKFFDIYHTEDAADYDEIMKRRLRVLRNNHKKIFGEKHDDTEGYEWYEKTFDNFRITNGPLRTAHTDTVLRYLRSGLYYTIYLLASPGIGKTYSFCEYFRSASEHGILSFYISPRINVNTDFIKKMEKLDGCLVINTDSLMKEGIITAYGGESLIKAASRMVDDYYKKNPSEQNKVRIMSYPEYIEYFKRMNVKKNPKDDGFFQRSREVLEKKKEQFDDRVMEKLGKFLRIVGMEDTENRIKNVSVVLTSQSFGGKNPEEMTLKMMMQTVGGGNNSTVNKREGSEIRMLTDRFKEILVMIDEISGSEEGNTVFASFRNAQKEIRKRVKDAGLPDEKFTLIVADASMNARRTALAYTRNEPESFIIDTPETEKEGLIDGLNYIKDPSGVRVIEEKKYRRCFINVDCFPAKKLHIRSKIRTEYDDMLKDRHPNRSAGKMECDFLNEYKDFEPVEMGIDDSTDGTVTKAPLAVLYIQDKELVGKTQAELEEFFCKECGKEQSGKFIYTRSLDAYSDAEERKALMEEVDENDDIKAVVMTSSGARGISFKRATHLYFAVPTFSTAANYAELIQAIYRGRGNNHLDENTEKYITFYFDLAPKFQDKMRKGGLISRNDKGFSINEGETNKKRKKNAACNAFAMSTLLLYCIETRIYGYAEGTGRMFTPLGRQGLSDKDTDYIYDTKKTSPTEFPDNAENARAFVKTINQCFENETMRGTRSKETIDSIIDIVEQCMKAHRVDFVPKEEMIPRMIIFGGMMILKENEAVFNVHIDQKKTNVSPKKLRASLNGMYERAKEECGNNRQNLNKLKNMNALADRMWEMADSFSLADISHKKRYLALPCAALYPRLYEKQDYKAWHDEEEKLDIVDLMNAILRNITSVSTRHPYDAAYGYAEKPYMAFTALDFEYHFLSEFSTTSIMNPVDTNLINVLMEKPLGSTEI